jgi:hypothetical protein
MKSKHFDLDLGFDLLYILLTYFTKVPNLGLTDWLKLALR